jgi:hypothetical protein
VTIRLRETRVHHVFGTEQTLRQYTEREEAYGVVKQSCSQRQIAEGVLDDPDVLAPKLAVKLDVTEVFAHQSAPAEYDDVAAAIMKKDIARKNAEAEEAFKKRYKRTFLLFLPGTKAQILTSISTSAEEAFKKRYSVYVLYWYKSTNTDLAEGAAASGT